MARRRVIETYNKDMNNLVDVLGKLVSSYRTLIGSAHDLNEIALGHKKDVRDAIKRANDLGKIIDDIIEVLECTAVNTNNYVVIKNEIMKNRITFGEIEAEMQEDLIYNNQ